MQALQPHYTAPKNSRRFKALKYDVVSRNFGHVTCKKKHNNQYISREKILIFFSTGVGEKFCGGGGGLSIIIMCPNMTSSCEIIY